MQYLFAAVFSKNEEGLLDVHFPDLPNCRTNGSDMIDAAKKAEAVLSICLFDMEQHGAEIPNPTTPDKVTTAPGETVALVKADTDIYRNHFANTKEIHTVEIAPWLAAVAKNSDINLSELLQDSIREEIGVPVPKSALQSGFAQNVYAAPQMFAQADNQPQTSASERIVDIVAAEPEPVIEVSKEKSKEKSSAWGWLLPIAAVLVLILAVSAYILTSTDLGHRAREFMARNQQEVTEANPIDTGIQPEPTGATIEQEDDAPIQNRNEDEPQHEDLEEAAWEESLGQEELWYDDSHQHAAAMPQEPQEEPDSGSVFMQPADGILGFAGLMNTNIHVPMVTPETDMPGAVTLTAGEFGFSGAVSSLVITDNAPGGGNSAFSGLGAFEELVAFQTIEHVILDAGGGVAQFWHIFSFYLDDTGFDYSNINEPGRNQTFANRSMHPSDVQVADGERIVTLIANAGGNARYVLHARLIVF